MPVLYDLQNIAVPRTMPNHKSQGQALSTLGTPAQGGGTPTWAECGSSIRYVPWVHVAWRSEDPPGPHWRVFSTHAHACGADWAYEVAAGFLSPDRGRSAARRVLDGVCSRVIQSLTAISVLRAAGRQRS
jgi:hypothetical protein